MANSIKAKYSCPAATHIPATAVQSMRYSRLVMIEAAPQPNAATATNSPPIGVSQLTTASPSEIEPSQAVFPGRSPAGRFDTVASRFSGAIEWKLVLVDGRHKHQPEPGDFAT